jgi:hypothetical protein
MRYKRALARSPVYCDYASAYVKAVGESARSKASKVVAVVNLIKRIHVFLIDDC